MPVFLTRTSCCKTTHANSYYGTWPGQVISVSVLSLKNQRIYRFCNKGQVFEHQKIIIKESQITQVKELSAFLCMKRCESLGSLK